MFPLENDVCQTSKYLSTFQADVSYFNCSILKEWIAKVFSFNGVEDENLKRKTNRAFMRKKFFEKKTAEQFSVKIVLNVEELFVHASAMFYILPWRLILKYL